MQDKGHKRTGKKKMKVFTMYEGWDAEKKTGLPYMEVIRGSLSLIGTPLTAGRKALRKFILGNLIEKICSTHNLSLFCGTKNKKIMIKEKGKGICQRVLDTNLKGVDIENYSVALYNQNRKEDNIYRHKIYTA